MSLAEIFNAIPEVHRRPLLPESPGPMRMMAAKGLAPMPPREMVMVMAALTQWDEPDVAEAAAESVRNLPDAIIGPVLDGDLPEVVLLVLAPLVTGRDEVVQRIVLNRATPDRVIALVAQEVSEAVTEMIAGNQDRCLRSREIVDGVRQNPNLLKSSSDRLFDFLARSGVFYDDMPEYEAALGRLSPSELQQATANIDLPPEASVLLGEDAEDGAEDEDAEPMVLDAVLVETPEAETPKPNDLVEQLVEDDGKKLPMLKLVNNLKISEKIALALKGNKEARTILVRDSNRLVAGAVIKSPRVTEQEIIGQAKNRSANDEVIRLISADKNHMRSYQVKLALAQNPKTPPGVAIKLLALLREADLRMIAKSKNVSSNVATQSKRLLMKRKRR